MLDHIGLTVADYGRSRAFFDAALKPLGVSVMMEVTAEQTGGHAHCGYGAEMKPFFWFGTGGPPTAGVHVAFTAKDRATVDAFYAAAMAAGGAGQRAAGDPRPLSSDLLRGLRPRSRRAQRRGGLPRAGLIQDFAGPMSHSDDLRRPREKMSKA
jgi:catechol 2,3-dioxygenase-like lactoylglutathione lyase family enzyme